MTTASRATAEAPVMIQGSLSPLAAAVAGSPPAAVPQWRQNRAPAGRG
jgi:hypothetical protein